MQPTRVGGRIAKAVKGQYIALAVFSNLGDPIADTCKDGGDKTS
jgi:hypothetical protein